MVVLNVVFMEGLREGEARGSSWVFWVIFGDRRGSQPQKVAT